MNTKRIAHLRLIDNQTGYRFVDRDGDMELLCNEITRQGLTGGEVANMVYKNTNGLVNLHYTTVEKWLSGKTKKPQHYTMAHVAAALGLEWKLVPIKKLR